MTTAEQIVDEVEQQVAEETADAPAEATTEEAPKAKKVKEAHACYCQTYEVVDPKDETGDSVFSTGCEQETKATFAQGHDARLVSFLVDGYFDGYEIRQVVPNGEGGTKTVTHSTPADAVAHISEPLAEKANKATLNRKAALDGKADRAAAREKLKAERLAAKEKAKADKAAAKEAEKPKNTGEVVAGSQTGDLPPLADGQARIKVGKFEYVADIDDEGNATYTDGAGEAQTINRDGYRLLSV